MWERYLSPSELTPEEARQVLALVNGAQSAEAIARAVEFPGELDVGLGVARRILARRAELGGAFASVAQLTAVPYVGPERFTEIVAAATGRVPRADTAADLRQELGRLAARIAALGGPGLRVTLRPVVPRLYLGQRLSLEVQVSRAADGRPVPDLALTLLTSWGRLRSADGFSFREGTSVGVRTGIDGGCRVSLAPPTAEPLRPEQETALEAALQELDPGADSPRAAAAGLASLARRYRREDEPELRAAIDICFQSFTPGGLQAVNTVDPLAGWPLQTATVVAHARAGAGAEAPSSVGASAVLEHGFRNWLPAWLAAYRDRARGESDLRGRLGELLDAGRNAGQLLPSAYGRIQRFLTREPGLVGQAVAREIGEQTVRELLADGVGALPVEARLAVRQGLGAAARAVGAADGLRLLQGIGQTRAALRTTEQTAAAGLQVELAGLRQQLAGISGAVDRVSADLGSLRGTVDTALPALRAGLDAAATAVGTLRAQVDERFVQVDQRLAQVQGGLTRVDGGLARLDADVARIGTRLDAKVDAGAFDTFRGRLETDLGGLLSDVDALKRNRPG